MKTQVIIVAAGSGVRFKSKVPKPFVVLKKKPLIAHSLGVFEKCAEIESVVIVGSKENLGKFERLAGKFRKVKVVVVGGASRAESVGCGLAVLDENTDYVLVHDAARPLIDKPLILRIMKALKTAKAAIAAVPVKSTIKQANKAGIVEKTLKRDTLWEAQTPQGFHTDTLLKAHKKVVSGTTFEATDDAMLVEQMGVKVQLVMGDYRNIKITTPEDIKIAENLI